MQELRLYNTLTRRTEVFEPRTPGKVGVYCCGPTVYDVPHAGHARSAVAFDVLVRTLRGRNLDVTYVRNITDIDDKILARSRELGQSPRELSERMTAVYREDMAAIQCLPPGREPKVSESLAEVIALVERLVERGAAYVVDKGEGKRDVYFSVRSFTGYGKLSRRNVDELQVGARVETDEDKRDPLDFALWKGCAAGDWGWESPWGRGRPGWHIECSAMSACHLGHGFDIHAGGMDLIFPHHENEIAQSEAAHPGEGPFARVWMHNGFVNVDKEKMSKSLGNFVTVRDVLARNDAEAFRFFLLGVQYRGPIQFDTETRDGRVVFPGVDEAERRVDYLYETLARLAEMLEDSGVTVPSKLPQELATVRAACEQALVRGEAGLADDLNTPVALAEVGELARLTNELADAFKKRRKDTAFTASAAVVAHGLRLALERLADQLGILLTPPREYARRTRERRLSLRQLSAADVDRLVEERVAARRQKDFARSDALRAELTAKGISVRDAPDGTSTWSVDA
jgi:cysteinyl-tRNA synthetase